MQECISKMASYVKLPLCDETKIMSVTTESE